jgi:hypothetical protein
MCGHLVWVSSKFHSSRDRTKQSWRLQCSARSPATSSGIGNGRYPSLRGGGGVCDVTSLLLSKLAKGRCKIESEGVFVKMRQDDRSRTSFVCWSRRNSQVRNCVLGLRTEIRLTFVEVGWLREGSKLGSRDLKSFCCALSAELSPTRTRDNHLNSNPLK